jgi:hypothetical protein
MKTIHGTVTTTKVKDGTLYASVRVPRKGVTYHYKPVLHSGTGDLHGIKEGSRVILSRTTDAEWIILGTVDSEPGSDIGDKIEENERVIYSDDKSEIRLSKTNGTYQLDISAGADINLSAEGDVNISATGNVFIDGIDFDQHTHDYEDSTIEDTSDGSGSETTSTKTSDVPK